MGKLEPNRNSRGNSFPLFNPHCHSVFIILSWLETASPSFTRSPSAVLLVYSDQQPQIKPKTLTAALVLPAATQMLTCAHREAIRGPSTNRMNCL